LMVFGLFGFWVMYKQHKAQFIALVIFTLMNIYLLSTWTCWWYAESFGQRALVQSYLVLLIPMGYAIHFVNQQKLGIKSTLFGFLVLFVAFNQFQTWQMHQGLLHPSRMTQDAYWAHFLKTRATPNFEDLLLVDKSVPASVRMEQEHTKLTKTKQLRYLFESDSWKAFENNKSHDLVGAQADDNQIYSKDLVIKYPELTNKRNVIFRFQAKVFCDGDPKEIAPRIVLKMRHKGKPYYEHYIRLEEHENIEPFIWSPVELIFYSTDVRNMRRDELQIFAWLAGQGSFKIDDLRLSVYEGLR